MNNSKITLEEFISNFQLKLEQFKKDWEQNKKTNPDYFPNELNIEEWEEQLIIYLQNK